MPKSSETPESRIQAIAVGVSPIPLDDGSHGPTPNDYEPTAADFEDDPE